MAKSVFVVYYPGPPSGNAKLLKFCEEKKRAQEIAERFVIENGGLAVQIIELSVLSSEKYPKEAKENG